jgi:hypothetical protein
MNTLRRSISAAVLAASAALPLALAGQASAAGGPVPVAPYRGTAIRAATAPDLVWDVDGSTTDNSATVHLQKYTGANDQLWVIQPLAAGEFEIRGVHSRKCLDVQGASKENNAPVIQYTCQGGANQRFFARKQRNGFQIVSVNSGKCLDVSNGSVLEPAEGKQLVQYQCNDGNDKLWTFAPQ